MVTENGYFENVMPNSEGFSSDRKSRYACPMGSVLFTFVWYVQASIETASKGWNCLQIGSAESLASPSAWPDGFRA